jgi:integrase
MFIGETGCARDSHDSGNGGSFVAALMAQFLQDRDIKPRRFDSLVEHIADAGSTCEHVIVDNGASSFLPLADYMLSYDLPGLLAEMGHELWLHSVITGGQGQDDRLEGLLELLENFAVPVVVWRNAVLRPHRARRQALHGHEGLSGAQAANGRDRRDPRVQCEDDRARSVGAAEDQAPVPIDRVTLDLCEEVMRRLPEKLAPKTRNIGQLITRMFAMAVYPLRLIERSPIPAGFVPKASAHKALAYLYPDEDRRLMACKALPLEYRLLWGVLAREGMREGEALALTWADVDLERGAVRLDKNKTDDPRAWALNAGVVAALRAYRERYRKSAEPTDHILVDPLGRPHSPHGMADLLRAHLMEIGLVRERPELFTSTAERRRIRVHDLRGTFVTISLANGKSESWISDRTGHRSSQMISRYKRTARTFAELELGELAPLHEAIGGLSIGHNAGHGARKTALSISWKAP